MTVSNFHSFCQRILTENAADAGLPPRPDVLDGVGQVLLLRDLVPEPRPASTTATDDWTLREHRQVHQPVQGRARHARTTSTPSSPTSGASSRSATAAAEAAVERLETQGNLAPLRDVRGAYAGVRAERARRGARRGARLRPGRRREGGRPRGPPDDRRRPATPHARSQFAAERPCRASTPSPTTYVADGAALEVLRLTELAIVYRAYEEELARRGALDFGEQIAAVTQLFKTRPNVLRRYQRQFRYILVDEFQDANIAQIELIELLGRTPDRPDNVMVVGDDDQSIYRFRGASFAAFAEFDARFARPPAHDPDGRRRPARRRASGSSRTSARSRHVLTAANRLIGRNETRFEPDKRLRTDRPDGDPVELVVCAGAEDEAVAIVDAIKRRLGEATGGAGRTSPSCTASTSTARRSSRGCATRTSRTPSSAGCRLFETPEIRDLEQALRAIADPHDDVALVRMMTAGPWRLDALEILHVTPDRRASTGAHLIDVDHRDRRRRRDDGSRGRGATVTTDPATAGEAAPAPRRHRRAEPADLPRGPAHDPRAVARADGHRARPDRGRHARGEADGRQHRELPALRGRLAAANPSGTLAGFVDYLDAYQAAGGELPTSVELTEDVEGVRLMTLYQAKGLEFPIVFVPQLLDGEWPTREGWSGYFPRELLREAVPEGDIHTEEERRLLYVAMTRAQERLILTTHGGPARDEGAVAVRRRDRRGGGGEDVRVVDRTARGAGAADGDGRRSRGRRSTGSSRDARRVMPLPTARERRLALRLRASELVGLIEATDGDRPGGGGARERVRRTSWPTIGRAAAMAADEARAAGLDPLTFRTIALDTGAGANLLEVAPLPGAFSYSAFDTYERCPLQYAFRYVYRMPEPPTARRRADASGRRPTRRSRRSRRSAASARRAASRRRPARTSSASSARAGCRPAFGDQTTEEGYQRRVDDAARQLLGGRGRVARRGARTRSSTSS